MLSAFHLRSFMATYDSSWIDDPLHQNTSLEIEIVLEGRGVFEWTERRVRIESGHVVFIPPGIEHRFEAETHIRLAVLHLQGMPPALAELVGKFVQKDGPPKIATLSRLDIDRFEQLFREWLRVHASTLKEYDRCCRVWAEMLLLFLHEHSQSDLQAMTITKAADYLREHLRQNVQMSDLAALTGLTEASFRRTFEKIYRLSPKQYQQMCRLQEARWLLSATDKDMNEISDRLGFHRLHSFSQWFKSVEGVSPSHWRKQQKKSTDETLLSGSGR